MMMLRYIELFLLVSTSLFSDIKQYKIKNKMILTFIIVGLGTNIYYSGLVGAKDSIEGMLIPFFVLILIFAARMLGAGDIKLFCAMGSIMGVNYIVNNMIYTLLCGGVITLVLMLRRGILIKRLKYAFAYFFNFIFQKSIVPYADFSSLSEKEKFRFTYAIAVGVIVQWLVKYYYGKYFF